MEHTHKHPSADSARGWHQFGWQWWLSPKISPLQQLSMASASRTTEPFSQSWNGSPGLEVLPDTVCEFVISISNYCCINNMQFPFFPRWSYSGQKLLVSLLKTCPLHFCSKRERRWKQQLHSSSIYGRGGSYWFHLQSRKPFHDRVFPISNWYGLAKPMLLFHLCSQTHTVVGGFFGAFFPIHFTLRNLFII